MNVNGIISFILDHQVVLASLVVALVDFLIALNKNLESNGLIHSVYLLAKDIIVKAPKPNGPA